MAAAESMRVSTFLPIGFALGGLPQDAPRWGTAYKALLKEYFTRTMYVIAHTTSLPVETNSISLDPNVNDAWGLPAIRVTYQDHPDDMRTMNFLLQRSGELLEAAGAVKKWEYPVEEQTFSLHLLGTCRMGDKSRRVRRGSGFTGRTMFPTCSSWMAAVWSRRGAGNRPVPSRRWPIARPITSFGLPGQERSSRRFD